MIRIHKRRRLSLHHDYPIPRSFFLFFFILISKLFGPDGPGFRPTKGYISGPKLNFIFFVCFFVLQVGAQLYLPNPQIKFPSFNLCLKTDGIISSFCFFKKK